MRKLFALIAVLGMLTIGASSMLMAQENETTQTETTETYQEEEETTDPTVLEDESQIESTSFHAALKQKFIEGGAAFMSFVILCLIFGLAIAIERVIYLNNQLYHTVLFKWDFWKKECLGLVCLLD